MKQAERDTEPRAKIAVVDDDLRLAQLLKVVLEEAGRGYDVHVNRDIANALEFIKHVHPDLIILDIMLGVDPIGFETLGQLSNDPAMRHIPVVVSTAGIFPAVRYQEFFSPLFVLPKPFQLTELVSTVRDALAIDVSE